MSEQHPEHPRRVEPQFSAAHPSGAASTPGAAPPPGPRARARSDAEPGWDRSVLEKLVLATVVEQRRSRRWSIFFRFVGLVVVLLLVAAAMGWLGTGERTAGRHTALIEIDGVMDADGDASSERVNGALRSAFRNRATAGVILKINSPGGSPVQAGLISDEIRRLRALYPDVPIYSVVEDICASGGYYVAAASDEIFVDKASLIGSIGVLINGFGFTGTMEKLGVERRLIAAGDQKGFLDPFSPLPEDQLEHAAAMLQIVHQQFVETVRAGRGVRLKEFPGMFSGLVWTGATAIELGLADRLGSVQSVARDVIKAEDVVDFTRRRGLAERLARSAGVGAAETVVRRLGISEKSLQLQ
jgi:protease IV